MSIIALSLIVGLACLAVSAYDPNEVEQNALGCIQHMYELGGSKEGKLKISCDVDGTGKRTFKEIEISSGTGGWTELPWFAEGGQCKSKGNDPFFLKGSVVCAKRLLAPRYCGEETSEAKDGKNIQALIKMVTPTGNVCSPLRPPTAMEAKALLFIKSSAAAFAGSKATLDVYVDCKERKLDSLKFALDRPDSVSKLKLKAPSGQPNAQLVLECATRLLEQQFGATATGSTGKKVLAHLDNILATLYKDKPVCN